MYGVCLAIKQRLQIYASPYAGAIDCLQKIRQREGLSVLYRSYTTQLTMNIPFHSVHLVTYELLQDYLNYARTYDPLSHVISGAGAGAIASAVTTPLDVCKTLLNTQECCLASTGEPTCSVPRGLPGTSTNTVATQEARGLITAIRVIYTQGGIPAFFKGLTPRVLYQMPSTAVAWSCYEIFVSHKRMFEYDRVINVFSVVETFFCRQTNNIVTCLTYFLFKQVSEIYSSIYLSSFFFRLLVRLIKIVLDCFVLLTIYIFVASSSSMTKY